MRLIPVILAGVWLCAGAQAQVTTNPDALEGLGKPERPAAPVRRPQPRPRPQRTAKPSPPPAPAPETKPAAAAKPPAVPVTPPAILALPPPVAVPLAHPPSDPVVVVTDDAPGDASRIERGVRVTFGPDRVDLNPATIAALRAFARESLEQSGSSINVFAYAAGNQDDPSTPRRLSLARALAARAVLMQAGIASPRIYPRALGPAGGEIDPDRVDVFTGAPSAPASKNTAG